MSEKNRTVELTGTAILAALVIIFDYSLKYSGLKIPFPWYPNLKFDFTGIPIALSLFLYGFSSSIFTSFVAGVGIVARSGNKEWKYNICFNEGVCRAIYSNWASHQSKCFEEKKFRIPILGFRFGHSCIYNVCGKSLFVA
jgi:hypothetical protein